MAEEIKPVRRIVTGNDDQGRSCVLFDSAAPNVLSTPVDGRYFTDVWVFKSCPAVISGNRDDGHLPFSFEPPEKGGHLRINQILPIPPDYDPARDPTSVPLHPPIQQRKNTWNRGGQSLAQGRMHKTKTVDYAICLEGEIILVLDDGEYLMKPGDVSVQLGSWHAWKSRPVSTRMAYVMMSAEFEDGKDD
jgi:hypothetical protein